MRTNQTHPLIHLDQKVTTFAIFSDGVFLRQRYLEEKHSINQIAEEIGCSRSTVRNRLMELDIEIRQNELPGRRGQLAYGEKLWAGKVVPHLGELRIIREMVAMRAAGKSYGSIVRWLNRNKIPTKNRKKSWDRPTVYKIIQRYRRSSMA